MTKDAKETQSIRLSRDLRERVKNIAKAQGRSQSWLYEQAIKEYLRKLEEVKCTNE